MSKQIGLLTLFLLTLTVLAIATYFYLNRGTTQEQTLAKPDILTCKTDEDCRWYDSTIDSGRAQKCANSNIILAENATENSMAPDNTICLCMANKCDTATFTVSED
jgi:hypothetical protein